MSDCDVVTKEQPAGLPVLPWEFVQRIDGLEARIAELEKRPMVKSRAEYMRKYRKNSKSLQSGSVTLGADQTFTAIATVHSKDRTPKVDMTNQMGQHATIPVDANGIETQTVSDTPPA